MLLFGPDDDALGGGGGVVLADANSDIACNATTWTCGGNYVCARFAFTVCKLHVYFAKQWYFEINSLQTIRLVCKT